MARLLGRLRARRLRPDHHRLEGLWEGTDELVGLHRGLSGFTHEAAVTTAPVAPYHPAAVEFYTTILGFTVERDASPHTVAAYGRDLRPERASFSELLRRVSPEAGTGHGGTSMPAHVEGTTIVATTFAGGVVLAGR